MRIADAFDREPRAVQAWAARELDAAWRDYDVFVLQAPVASGKSLMARTIARCGPTAILTPTHALVGQYTRDWPELATDDQVVTYHGYLGRRAYQPAVVVDEAHRLIPFLLDKEVVTIWRHLYAMPEAPRSLMDLLMWAEHARDERVRKLYAKLSQRPDSYVVTQGTEDYRGRARDYVRLHPLTPRYNKPILWPRRVRKLVLMSATITAEDIYDLGLETKRVCYLHMPSPIPAMQRPVVYAPVVSAGYAHADRGTKLADALRRLLERHPERGLVHCTYQLMHELRRAGLDHPRLRWAERGTASAVYQEWLRGGPGEVLIAAGMEEGLDLVGDLARWQAICKLQYPSLADTAVLHTAQARPRWYQWQAARAVIQACGRVCRGPDDYGVTYILTSEFGNLMNQAPDLLPRYFWDSFSFGGLT